MSSNENKKSLEKSSIEIVRLSSGAVLRIPCSSSEKNDEKIKKKSEKLLQFEKVTNVWGSTAGAGSDFFDIYRKHRFKEMDRLEEMEREWKSKIESDEFKRKREERIKQVEELSRKKAEKRKRKKEKRKKLIVIKKKKDDEKNNYSGSGLDYEKQSEKHKEQTQEESALESKERKDGDSLKLTETAKDFDCVSDSFVLETAKEMTQGKDTNSEYTSKEEEQMQNKKEKEKENSQEKQVSGKEVKNRVNLIIKDADEDFVFI